MIAGTLDHETGTRNVSQLGGLRRVMPVTTIIAGLAAISMAGFGPVISFIGKELLLESVLEAEPISAILTPVVVLGSAFFVTVAALVGIRPFTGTLNATPRKPHEAPLNLSLGPGLLAVMGLLFGIAPGVVAAYLVAP